MVSDHINYLTFEDPASVNLVRRALKLAQAGDLYGAAETANVDVGHAQVVSEGLRRGMRYSIGAEVDNDPRARPDAQNIVDAMRPDGLIRSVHFIPIDHPVHGANWNWAFDNPEFASLYDHVGTEKTWEGYMAVLLDAIERLPGNIVGHFYVPAVFGHWPDDATLERYEDQLLDAVEARGMAVEFNTRFLYRDASDEEKQRYLDANRRLLRKAKDRGVGIAIGSDAHSPRDQSGAFDVVLGILDELDINEIVFPIAGRLARVALRYVKPAEPEPPPPPPPAPEPEPVAVAAAPAAVDPPAPAPAADAPAKPVRKARPGASSTRPKETSPDRAADRHADAAAFEPAPEPEPPAAPLADAAAEAPPAEPAPRVRKPAPKKAAAAPAPEPPPAPVVAKAPPAPKKAAPAPAPVPAKPAPKPPAKAAKPPVKPVAKPAAKPAAKPVKAAKPSASTKSAAKPAAKAPAKATPAAKTAAKKAPAKTAAKRPAPKAAPARKPVVKKAAPKKPVRAAAKPAAKKAPAKKAPVAKRAPAKKAPAKKPVAKKAPAKKPAAKRR